MLLLDSIEIELYSFIIVINKYLTQGVKIN